MNDNTEMTIEERYRTADEQVDGISRTINEILSVCSRSNLALEKIKRLKRTIRCIEDELHRALEVQP